MPSKIFKFLFICALSVSLTGSVVLAKEITSERIKDRRAELEAELADIMDQIDTQRVVIKDKQREVTSLERDVTILDARINKSRLEIRARNLVIDKLGSGITKNKKTILQLKEQVVSNKISLSELMRRTNEMDSSSLVEIVLGHDTLSEFFEDFSSFEYLQKEIQVSLGEIKGVYEETEKEKQSLEEKKTEELELRYIQELEKQKTEKREKSKQRILTATKGEEKAYQKILDAKEKSAAAIRSELFLLRGSTAIPFEQAANYAHLAWKQTGVRPAFILGVISYESELGANLGSGNWKEDLYECYKSIGYYKSAEKQKKAFLAITSELGVDSMSMPVSKAPYYGCGGAMGPAQFMPTTWMLYKDKVASLTGHKPPSPWDPLDAFMAAASLLKDNGAAAGGYTAERRSALRYFAGGNWQKASYAFYGDDVMVLAKKYQGYLDKI